MATTRSNGFFTVESSDSRNPVQPDSPSIASFSTFDNGDGQQVSILTDGEPSLRIELDHDDIAFREVEGFALDAGRSRYITPTASARIIG